MLRQSRPFPAAFLLTALVFLGALSLPTAGAGQAGRAARFVERQGILCVRTGLSQNGIRALLRRHGLTLLRQFADRHLMSVRFPRGRSTSFGILLLRKDLDVAFCHPNFVYHALQRRANDPGFQYLWGLENTGQENGNPTADIDAPEAWRATTGARNVVVAVVDTGVDYAHPDLAANIWTNPREIPDNRVDDDRNGYVDDVHGWDAFGNDGNPQDANGHGTHVAGTIGAVGNNGVGVTGVNWRVSIMVTRFLDADGSGTTADAITCLDYINTMKDRGVNVIATNNSSGGAPAFDRALRDTIARANERGILFVAAAGNDGKNNDVLADYPGNYDLPNVISVAATDRFDRLADFSNYGARQVDLAAPGVEILSTVPRFIDRESPYRFLSGTSMAAPHVTGAAALLKAAEPSLSHQEIRERLLRAGTPLTGLGGKTVTGRRLNLIQALQDTAPPPEENPTLVMEITAPERRRIGRVVMFRVQVTDPRSGLGVGGALVRLSLKTANGNLIPFEALTSADGRTRFRFRIRRKEGRGTYILTGSAERAGFERGADVHTVVVR